MAMRDQIREAIEAGGATKESLLALTGTTEKGLASQFTYLRMIGTCPMRQEDGTYKIVSSEEWAEKKASGGGGAAANLTPEERLDKAEKRVSRAATAYDNAKKKAEANPDDKLSGLKLTKAECELEIANIEVGKLEAIVYENPTDPVEAQEDVEEEYEEDEPEYDEDEGELE